MYQIGGEIQRPERAGKRHSSQTPNGSRQHIAAVHGWERYHSI